MEKIKEQISELYVTKDMGLVYIGKEKRFYPVDGLMLESEGGNIEAFQEIKDGLVFSFEIKDNGNKIYEIILLFLLSAISILSLLIYAV